MPFFVYTNTAGVLNHFCAVGPFEDLGKLPDTLSGKKYLNA